MYGSTNLQKTPSRVKVAGFDLDGTLVKSRSGRPSYMISKEDWTFFNSTVVEKLKDLHKQGRRLGVVKKYFRI